MGGGIVAQECLEEVTWDWIPWKPPQRLLSIMGDNGFLKANCYEEVLGLRNVLRIPCEEQRR
eukprot:12927058-Prorocentrum_lima.AAC.1